MELLFDCIQSFRQLLDIEYCFTLGRRGKKVDVVLRFQDTEVFHLMGTQYLIDREQLRQNHSEHFRRLLEQDMDELNYIKSSDFYSKIEDRISNIPNLEAILDDDETVFQFIAKNAYSTIGADYLICSKRDKEIYLFLNKNKDGTYCCSSMFTKGNRDYTFNQPQWTILKKSKTRISTGETTVIYERPKKTK